MLFLVGNTECRAFKSVQNNIRIELLLNSESGAAYFNLGNSKILSYASCSIKKNSSTKSGVSEMLVVGRVN